MNNTWGIYLESSNNEISYNNFLMNVKNAGAFECSNTWNRNFWNRPRLLPVIIWSYNPPRILPSSLDIDWRPAKEPNDINGVKSHRATQEVTMPRNRAINGFFLKFLEQFPILRLLLQRLGLQ